MIKYKMIEKIGNNAKKNRPTSQSITKAMTTDPILKNGALINKRMTIAKAS